MSADSPHFVLDSYAVLAFLEGERGMERIQQVLLEAEGGQCTVSMSWINLGEVMSIIERERGLQQARETLAFIQALPVQLDDLHPEMVLAAAHVKAGYRLSYADTFAVAAAQAAGATLITGDPEFAAVEHIVPIEWLI